KLLGGMLTVSGSPGHGTTFCVTLKQKVLDIRHHDAIDNPHDSSRFDIQATERTMKNGPTQGYWSLRIISTSGKYSLTICRNMKFTRPQTERTDGKRRWRCILM